MDRVLVLGGNGFVGRHLVRALATEPDLVPVALVRGDASGLPAGTDVRRADATDAAGLGRALAGIDAAVNCIAGGEAAMVAATRTLCDAGRAAGVRRLVHLSSMAVYGPATGTVEETHALDPSLGAYARAKVACEEIVGSFGRDGAEAVILRPGCIHGPGSTQWTGRIGRLLRQHRLGDLGEAGDGTCNLTFIDDMVRAVLAALRRPAAGGEAFNVSDPDPRTWNAYLVDLGRAIGAVPVARLSGRWLTVEARLLAAPLTVAERALGRLPVRIRLPAAITPSLVRTFRQEITLDHRKADAVLGFDRTPPAAAIAAAADWVRSID